MESNNDKERTPPAVICSDDQTQNCFLQAGAPLIETYLKDQLKLHKSVTDLHLACDDGYIPVHRYILMGASPLLNDLLINQDPSELAVIHLAGVNLLHAVQLMSLLYCGKCVMNPEDQVHVYNALQSLGIPTKSFQFRVSKQTDHVSIPRLRCYKNEEEKDGDDMDMETTFVDGTLIDNAAVFQVSGSSSSLGSLKEFTDKSKVCCNCEKSFKTEKDLIEHLTKKCAPHLAPLVDFSSQKCHVCNTHLDFTNIWGLLNHVVDCRDDAKKKQIHSSTAKDSKCSQPKLSIFDKLDQSWEAERTVSSKTNDEEQIDKLDSNSASDIESGHLQEDSPPAGLFVKDQSDKPKKKRKKRRVAAYNTTKRKKPTIKAHKNPLQGTEEGSVEYGNEINQAEDKDNQPGPNVDEASSEFKFLQDDQQDLEGTAAGYFLPSVNPNTLRIKLGISSTSSIAQLPLEKIKNFLRQCPLCLNVFDKLKDVAKCLRFHGYRYCYACLQILPYKGYSYEFHCTIDHNISISNKKIACPFCLKDYEYKVALPTHLANFHCVRLLGEPPEGFETEFQNQNEEEEEEQGPLINKGLKNANKASEKDNSKVTNNNLNNSKDISGEQKSKGIDPLVSLNSETHDTRSNKNTSSSRRVEMNMLGRSDKISSTLSVDSQEQSDQIEHHLNNFLDMVKANRAQTISTTYYNRNQSNNKESSKLRDRLSSPTPSVSSVVSISSTHSSSSRRSTREKRKRTTEDVKDRRISYESGDDYKKVKKTTTTGWGGESEPNSRRSSFDGFPQYPGGSSSSHTLTSGRAHDNISLSQLVTKEEESNINNIATATRTSKRASLNDQNSTSFKKPDPESPGSKSSSSSSTSSIEKKKQFICQKEIDGVLYDIYCIAGDMKKQIAIPALLGNRNTKK